MILLGLLLSFLLSVSAAAQTACGPTPLFSPCEITFDLNPQEAAQHPKPYLTVQLQAEFRSPRHRTYLLPAYWDGGARMVIRFAPTEVGDWDFRISGNLARFDGKLGKLTATESQSPGFVKVANVHHWAYSESGKAHLWMGETNLQFARMERGAFDQYVKSLAALKVNHLRGLIAADSMPDLAWFQEVDRRIRLLNANGITADVLIGGPADQLTRAFPTWQDRERYIRWLVARYSAMDITWQGVQDFETYKEGRSLMKEIGEALKKMDPYQHPRSAGSIATASALLQDGWMDHIGYGSASSDLGAVEHQLYTAPAVCAEVKPASGDAFRKRLWNATMNGQYPSFSGGDAAAQKVMSAWLEFFSRTRHWELEPFFDVDGGRALALDEIEYIIYIEKPAGPVEVDVAKHGYDVYWFNPIDGEYTKMKNFKGDKFVSEPPDTKHDWVLHLSRDGTKDSMARSYKFESRPVPVQEVEASPQKVPFEIVQPASDEISLSKPYQYGVKLKRETRATRSMMYLWTGEVVADGQGARVIATGAGGTASIAPEIAGGIAKQFPGVFAVRVSAMNANGKVYIADKVYRLVK